MGAFAGLLGGVGILLIWMACTSDPPQWRSRRSRLLADILVQAGAGRTSPTMFVLGSIGLGLLVGLVFLGDVAGMAGRRLLREHLHRGSLPHHFFPGARSPYPTSRGVAGGRRHSRLRGSCRHEPSGGAD